MVDPQAGPTWHARPLVGELGESASRYGAPRAPVNFADPRAMLLLLMMMMTMVVVMIYPPQVLGLVGCTIENGDEIAGARVVDKSKVGDGRTIV